MTQQVTGIQAWNVSASFERKTGGRRKVLSAVEFHAKPGQVTALVGRNGSGKTTLLRCLAGLMPYQGTVAVSGQNLQSLGSAARARAIGYVPQRTRLTAPLTVRQVAAQARFAHRGAFRRNSAEDQDAVARALDLAGALHLKDRRFPDLSGGEQQRVLIARSIASGAGVFLMDEPTSSQDVRCSLEIHRLVRRVAELGAAVVVVLHGLDEVRRHADQVVVLDEGKVFASGTARSIIAPGCVEAVFGVEVIPGGAVGFDLTGQRAKPMAEAPR